ncbi:MAG: hypothetical protein HZA03_11015 [Nitrospinae bacterium]|nr:hypothetical protein [Nitrospinota bacterium]
MGNVMEMAHLAHLKLLARANPEDLELLEPLGGFERIEREICAKPAHCPCCGKSSPKIFGFKGGAKIVNLPS